jgi:peptidoglycan/xylan/chitin deacetylase (PgdA/CDA1 family)
MTARSVVNLTVHGIGPVIRTLEPGEEQTWVSVTQFEQVLDATVGRPDVRITFDDGNSSDLEIALPRLLERGLTAEFFVLAGRLDEKGKLDAAGVRELERAGMRVGSHGWAHRDWRRIDETQAAQEFSEAHQVLAEVTGHPIFRVAVPFGSYDRKVLNRARQARVTRIYTSDGGRVNPNSWLQARNSLRHDVGPEWTKRVLDGTPSMALRARRRAARVVKRMR